MLPRRGFCYARDVPSRIASRRLRRSVSLRGPLAVLLCALPVAMASGADPAKVDFNFQIRPLLSDRCFACHGPDEKARKKKLRLDTREGLFKELEDGMAVVKPGDLAKSELVRRVFATDDDQMPPEKSNLKLTVAEKDLLKRWVARGAEYKSHWSFNPVEKVSPPKPRDAKWARNPVDSFVLAKIESEKLRPAPEASRETLLRRLALNLTGLPPTSQEIDSFLKDKSRDAYERVVEKYLASPAYGERMALDWLDLARYADTYGYQSDVERDMSPWRDWVIRAFNDNLRYDDFLRWQIAGDLLPNATREQKLATAFNRLHRQTNEGGSVEEEFRAEYISDRVNTFGTAMLGLTLGCARCHDHKYDPVTQRDYYSLAAFFNNIDESGLYSHFTRATPTPTLLLWPEGKEKQHGELKMQIAGAEAKLQETARDAGKEFQKWLGSDGEISQPQPIARFQFDSVTNHTTPDSVSANVARLEDGPVLVAGAPSTASARTERNNQLAETVLGAPTNFALQFSGDNQVVCKGVGDFKRTDAFSFALWLKPAEVHDRAVILHHSRAWTDSASRGYELVLDHGKPFFGLIHFWPGNAIAVRAKEVLPTSEWSQIVVTYDGSSRAAGIQLFLNGTRMETEVVRDHLYKDIVHRKEWGDAEVGGIHLALGARFRDNGFKNGLLDDVQVFDVALTAAEVELAARGTPGRSPTALEIAAARSAALQYFLARKHEPYRAALAELKKLREQENALVNDVPEIMVMDEMPQRRVSHLLKRGAYDAPGDEVQPETPAKVLEFPATAPRNRLGLAQWLTDRRNPLTARVVVNRVWKTHFGRGLVATPEDFGSQGRLPSHPELLDWLAGWLMDNGWDVKALHRLIVTSATFRQSSRAPRELVERDPENRLLARGPKMRLLAEQIRDGALAASGLLNRSLGGLSVKPYQPAGLWEQSGTGKTYTQDHGEKLYRRSLYTFWRRTAPPASMLTFDALTREVCTAKRETTATPLQSLVLLNDPQFIEAARVLSEKLLKQFPNDEAKRNGEAFRELTGRLPDRTETKILRQLFSEQKNLFTKDDESAKKLLSTGESKWDESLPRADFAALTTLVSAIMNFDEFVVEK
ncbi:MAG: DUF1553 domain-containing protein [Pedosphaera sp.]|nr:DUF1553 domain-containing protein [Pedosphaera sp.]